MTVLTYPNPDYVPTEVKNTAMKYTYTYILKELLRLKHNVEGVRFNLGEITEAEFRDFQDNWYDPRSKTVTDDLLELREAIKQYVVQFKDNINLEDIPVGD